jgi:ribose transport system substrate-binding protein
VKPLSRNLTLFVGAVLVLGACTKGPTAGSASGTSAAAASGVDLTAVTQVYNNAKAVPTFTPPGPAFDASKARGKKIFYIPLSSADVFDSLITQASVRAAQSAGVNITVYANQGQPSEWVQGMNTAISQKADLIVLEGAPDTALLVPQIDAAKRAGIAVVSTHLYDSSYVSAALAKYPGLAAIVPANHYLGGALMADSAIVNSGGKVNALFLTSNEVQPAAGIAQAFKDELAKYCPATCKVDTQNIPLTDWATKIPGTVQSALIRDRSINYVVPVFDGMTQYIAAGVTQSGASNRIHVSAYNGTASVLQMLQRKNIVVSDAGEPTEWLGYADIDQALRILSGVSPLSTEKTPLRIFDSTNVSEAGKPAVQTKGYGDTQSMIDGYKKLWGLG